jgi:hypothetical protein
MAKKMRADDYHGFAFYSDTAPDIAETPGVDVYFTLEEAMKLSLAIQSCLLRLNKWDKREGEGRKMGMMLALKTKSKTVMVTEEKVK